MTEHRDGRVVTFYSYKGGTGRTMALANIAWILAANGKRVLVVDWDLESPGLHRFFHPFFDPRALDATGGVVDLLRRYLVALTDASPRPEDWHVEYAKVSQFAFSLNWRHFPEGGGIAFMSAGRQDTTYAASLTTLDWDRFYDSGGLLFLNALRRDMQAHYDYTLIDSRTGVSDVADICTTHLPDVLVDCFTLSEQGMAGAQKLAQDLRNPRRPIRVLPVPMRVDPAELERANAGRTIAMQRFAGLPAGLTDAERAAYWREVEVPYQAFYAYEEILATIGDLPGGPSTLSASYERLTRYITDGRVHRLPPLDEGLRSRTVAQFLRRTSVPEEQIVLWYAPEDQAWAEWIEEVLVSVGVIVYHGRAGKAAGGATPRELVIISHGRSLEAAERQPLESTASRPPLGVYVADVRYLPAFPTATSVTLHDRTQDEAVELLLRLVGHPDSTPAAITLRYPGREPAVFNVPARNTNFTGREEDLRALRKGLLGGKHAALVETNRPVALQGLGGIGKTQVAIEYAHRFRKAYDLVWWIVCDPPTFIDTAIADLAKQLEIVTSANMSETTRAVRAKLGPGTEHRRWLLIFDNARDYEQIQPYLPEGDGEVLITSRNQVWVDRVQAVAVDVFARAESITHLQRRVPGLSTDDAAKVAETLGDLPIAVAAAGAWLKETGTPVAEYLREIEQQGPAALTVESALEQPLDPALDQSVEATWDLSLRRLEQQSSGAYRLLQLCSVLAPETALALIYSNEMAVALKPYDKSVADRHMRGSLVQQINRLALLKLDVSSGQIHVHRLLQHAVRRRMTADQLSEARHQVHLVLSRSRADHDIDNPESWPRFEMLWPHLVVSGAANCTEESVRALIIDRVRYHFQRGGLDQGEELAREIDKSWTALLAITTDPTERDVLQQQILHLRFNLANILRDRAKFRDAYRLDQDVLAAQEELLGGAHSHTLMTANGLAADLRALGRYSEALKLDESTYAAWVEHFGDDYPRTLNALNNLAASHRLMGDYREARARDAEVYERQRQITGNDRHPITLRSAANLGRDLREAGEYQESVNLLRGVADAYRATFGENSRFALNAATNLAVSLRSAGQAEEAARLLERACEQLAESVGADSPDTLACRLSLSLNHLSMGKIPSAAQELAAVRDAYERSLGDRHPHTLVCVSNLGAVARAQGDLTAFRSLATTAAADIEAVLGPRHPYALAAATNLAVSVAEAGDTDLAAARMEDIMPRLRDVLGPTHPDTIRGEANLALARRPRHGAVAGAEAIEKSLERRLGPAHPAVDAFRERRYLHRVLDPHPF